MAATSFAAQIAGWAERTQAVTEAVRRESASRVIAEMQKVGPSRASTRAAIAKAKKKFVGPPAPAGEGGAMPVDTGFLRSSLRVSDTMMPTIDASAFPTEGASYSYSESEFDAVIVGAGKKTIHAGYTAAYAGYMEYGFRGFPGYAFVRKAAQKWQGIVSDVVAEVKAGKKSG